MHAHENPWFTVRVFLRPLDGAAAQGAVPRRRLAFLEEPASFFHGDRPSRVEELTDPFRRAVLTIARATSRAELRRLRETLHSLVDRLAPRPHGAARNPRRRPGAQLLQPVAVRVPLDLPVLPGVVGGAAWRQQPHHSPTRA